MLSSCRKRHPHKANDAFFFFRLLTNAQTLDQIAVALDIFVCEVLQQLLAAAYQCQKCTTTRVILVVTFEVATQFLNSECKKSNLPFC